MNQSTQERDRQLFNDFLDGIPVSRLANRFGLPINQIGSIIRAVAKQRNPALYAIAVATAGAGPIHKFIRKRYFQFAEVVAEELQMERDNVSRLHELGPDLHAALTTLLKAAPPELANSPAGQQALRVLMKASGLVPADA